MTTIARRVPALATTVVLVGLAAGPAAALSAPGVQPTGQVSAVHATGNQIGFVVSAPGLPAGARLDPTRVRVSLDGVALPATARVAGGGAGTGPAQLVWVLLDTSQPMAGADLAAAKRVAADVAGSLPAEVAVGLITSADAPTVRLGPTRDRAQLAAALQTVAAGGNTALYDAMAAAAAGVSAARLPAGTVVRMLVLSDWADNASHVSLEDALSRLRRARVPVDVIPFRFLDADDPAEARQAAAGSAGRLVSAADAGVLATAFHAAARTLPQQLAVTARVPAELAGRSGHLRVQFRAGALAVAAGIDVTLPGAAGSGAGSTTPPVGSLVGGSSRWMLWVGLGLALAGLLALGAAAFGRAGRSQAQRGRIAQLERYRLDTAAGPASGSPAEAGSPLARAALDLVDRLVAARGVRQAVAADLDRAGLKLRVQEWMLLRVCGCAGLATVLVVLTGSLLLGVPIGVIVGWLGTRAVLRMKAGRRCAAFAAQLPDVLQLVAGSLRSGFSLSAALDAVVRDGSQPAAGEFARALAETRLGVPLEDALDTVALRMGSGDLGWTVMTIRIQRDVGGNLAEVLLTTVQTMRERAQVRRQVRALTAEGRLSAYILVALPIAVAGLLFATRRAYMHPLYSTAFGALLLGGAGALILLGAFWMSRLVKVEV